MIQRKIIQTALLALLVAACPAAGQTVMHGADGPLTDGAIRALVDGAPSEAGRPGEDALILFEGVWVDVRDGLAEVRVQRLTKLYTEWSVEHLGDPRIAWDEGRQELTVHASRTYLPDGRTVDTPTEEEQGYSGTNEVTPNALALATDHLDIREMVVTRVGLVRESVILLDYTVKDLAPSPVPFHMLHHPQGEFPILAAAVSAGPGITAETVNPAGRLYDLPEAELRSGRSFWYLTDLPARPHDSRARLGDQIPWIALSAAKDWQEAVEKFDGAVRAAAAPGEALRTAMMKREKEAPGLGGRATIESYLEMAAERTETVRYRCWNFLAAPRKAEQVLRSSYATPAERAALLLACCRARGWKTELILPPRWATLSTSAPALEALGDPLLRTVDDDGAAWWIDPMAGRVSALPPAGGGAPVFVSDGSSVRRETLPAAGDFLRADVYWDLAEGTARAEVEMSGPLAAALDPRKPNALVDGWIAGWAEGAERTDLVVHESGEDRIRFSATIAASPPEADDRGRIVLTPSPFPADLGGLVPAGMTRAHAECDAVLFPASAGEARARWIVRLPEGRRAETAETATAKWNGSEWTAGRQQAGDRLTMDLRIRWEDDPVRPGEYGAYRDWLARVLDPRAARIVLLPEEAE